MQLFKLSRLYLDTKCGKEEGSRLDSQLTIQKSLAGVSIYCDAQINLAIKGSYLPKKQNGGKDHIS